MIEYLLSKVLKKLRGRAIRGSKIDRSAKIEAGSVFLNSQMEKYSYCGYDCKIINAKIGSFCSIADNVIIGGAEHPITWVSTSPVFYKGRDSVKKKFVEYERPKGKQTIIGNDVWIGDCVIIKAGVTIGDGVVIGMGSVVTKDIPAYEMWAGNPAHIIRKRFNDDVIKGLLTSKWWEMKDCDLQVYSQYIREPEDFICIIEESGKK